MIKSFNVDAQIVIEAVDSKIDYHEWVRNIRILVFVGSELQRC